MKRITSTLMCLLITTAFAVPAVADRDYIDRHGYRERPYDKHRHYKHQQHRGYEYTYRGHWRSWDDFDRYAREHPWMYKHGGYYREDTHLMFRYCEPDTGSCFFFSIGR